MTSSLLARSLLPSLSSLRYLVSLALRMQTSLWRFERVFIESRIRRTYSTSFSERIILRVAITQLAGPLNHASRSAFRVFIGIAENRAAMQRDCDATRCDATSLSSTTRIYYSFVREQSEMIRFNMIWMLPFKSIRSR